MVRERIMRRGIARIIGILGAVMIALYASWEVVEQAVWAGGAPGAFYLVRGISTGVLMSVLAAWLMARCTRGYEEILRRQSEEAIRTRRFFENIIRDAGEGIISFDQDGRVRSWNKAAEDIYGYRADEIVGRTVDHLVPADLQDERELERLDATVSRQGFVRDVETQRVRKDGAIRTVRIARSALRDADGNVIGSTAIVRDVTAEKDLEQRVIQAEKLAAIGQAGAGIAHEIRNAIAGIAGTVGILKRSPAWKDLPDGFSDEIDHQVERMARIVNDLLAYARPGPLHTQPTDLHRLLRNALDAASRSGESTGKSARIDFIEDEFVSEVDPAWTEQAFGHLVRNAYQAMRPGGVLEISTRRRGDALEIRFSDDGLGMAPEVKTRAFEPFFTTKARGSGLGLPIVRMIIEAHRGSIRLDSAPGGGTAVVLVLPPVTGRAEESEGPEMRTKTMKQMKTGAGALAVLMVLALTAAVSHGAEPEYVGESKCKMCHRTEHEKWAAGPHATAMDRLQGADRENAECLQCHSTGHGMAVAANASLSGVQCEACHGPGSLYKSPKVMSKSKYKADPDAAHQEVLGLGLIVPDADTCRGCHNEKSPTFKGFDHAQALEEIRHWE